MNHGHCQHETEVLEAVESGRWPDATDGALRSHAAACPVCADVALVAEYFARQQRLELQTALPNPGLIWWKAQIMARREAAERATQPIAIASRVAAACGIVALVAAALWEWPLVYAWTVRSNPSSRLRDALDVVASLARGSSNAVFVMSAAACLALAAFVLYVVWAEE